MLTKLNKKQIKLMDEVRDEWLDRIFSCKLRINRKQATKYINWLYDISGLQKPLIIFLDSPLGIQYGANMIGGSQVRSQVYSQVWSQVYSQVRSQVRSQVYSQVEPQVEPQVYSQVYSQVESQVWSQVRSQVSSQVESQVRSQVRSQVSSQVESQVSSQVRSQVWSQVEPQVYSQVYSQVEPQVWSQVEPQVWSQVEPQVRSQVEPQVRSQVESDQLKYFDFAYYGNIADYYWVAFYDYFRKIGKVKLSAFNNFVFLLKAGIYDMIQLDKACIVSDMPCKILCDLENRLHSLSSSAIEWRDGYCLYFVHGVAVPEKIILHPEKLTKEDWIKEPNVEVRRVIQEQMGSLFVEKIGGKVINKSTRGKLIEVKLPNDPERVSRYVKVKDSSTTREYYLRVPPTINSADEGVAWTFGLEIGEYQPVQES